MSSCVHVHFNSVIQSLNTVIVLLFCYLPIIYYLPVFCYSAIPLVTGPVLVLVGIWYWLLLYLTGIHIHLKSNALLTYMIHDACMCIASMPFERIRFKMYRVDKFGKQFFFEILAFEVCLATLLHTIMHTQKNCGRMVYITR